MIVPDVNLLVYAYNAVAPKHRAAREWWEQAMNGDESVGLAWASMLGFIRLVTNRRIVAGPLDARSACAHVRSWLDRPHVVVLSPGVRHLDLVEGLMVDSGVTGAMTTDVHLAALAMEHQAELNSADSDFARFAGLRWRNPLT